MPQSTLRSGGGHKLCPCTQRTILPECHQHSASRDVEVLRSPKTTQAASLASIDCPQAGRLHTQSLLLTMKLGGCCPPPLILEAKQRVSQNVDQFNSRASSPVCLLFIHGGVTVLMPFLCALPRMPCLESQKRNEGKPNLRFGGPKEMVLSDWASQVERQAAFTIFGPKSGVRMGCRSL